MTDYNDGKWHTFYDYKGGIHKKTEVEVITDTGNASIAPMKYSDLEWYEVGFGSLGKPIAFRVIKEHKEPREYTIDPRKNIIWYDCTDDMVHVREVIDNG